MSSTYALAAEPALEPYQQTSIPKPEPDASLLPAPPYLFRQRPLSITLHGPAIFASCLALALLIHMGGSRPSEVLVMLMPWALLVRNDYQNFINLGPGGTPSTLRGYLRISWLRLWAIRDPFAAPKSRHLLPVSGILPAAVGSQRSHQALPYRPGPRPHVVGIAPQRQLDQHGSRPCYLALRRAMQALADRRPLAFGTERSCVEKHGLALFARHPLHTSCQGEICHVHDSDHSLHMCLHPDDIAEVLRKGWGQRHPLARKRWFPQMPVSPDFVMIYAPRNQQELEVTYRVIEAAIWYTLAERVDLDA
ncbi:hypothetical protein CDD82_5794 [Ophiocordyceps australis]|uniref:Luciferase domain-containing protein n=1 Tax=Ophiocordyceps australis TaxID=1399860 RepID=A0A2C5YVM7_9HYPO|nr:hypothetical protein CDD82_5794 [Ophiocordyceps australis]